MQTVLFHSTIFGPVKSRRLGVSLGINLMANDGKLCSFDCLYCEAGYNAQGPGTTGVPSRRQVAHRLETRLRSMDDEGEQLDVITFSGNGEPTLHPEFAGIVDDVLRLRNHFFPQAKVSVLSNATMAHRPAVARALRKVDNNILKLDSAVPATMRALNRPAATGVQPEGIIATLSAFTGQCIVQTLLTRGTTPDGKRVDNTTDSEIEALIDAYRHIRPRDIQLYTIDRPTPCATLEKIPDDELDRIRHRVAAALNP